MHCVGFSYKNTINCFTIYIVKDFDFLSTNDVAAAAKRLLGCTLQREVSGRILSGRIIEVEAYDQYDPASHAYIGPLGRAATMFGPPGHLYVYFTYGMHYCCNVVVGKEGYGAGVLIRALEPIEGQDIMIENRGGKVGAQLMNGPAKICQALKIDRSFDGHDLIASPIKLLPGVPLSPDKIIATPRMGISKAKEVLWRFLIKQQDES
jgi:DNA-3-methyladenine glycosylase